MAAGLEWAAMVTLQLPLNVSLRDDATLANYHAGDNHEVLERLRTLGSRHDDRVLYLWGGPGAGKTHLLQAVCHDAGGRGDTCAYLPMRRLSGLSTAVVDGLEQLDVVCVDDVQAVAGRDAWETALFHLFNRCRDGRGRLLIGADAAPARAGLRLPDLASRLGWGLVFHVRPLNDAQMRDALQLRARQRGMELPDDVARYLLRHYRRDMTSLAALLERLDRASLAAQRRLTVPFVRQWL